MTLRSLPATVRLLLAGLVAAFALTLTAAAPASAAPIDDAPGSAGRGVCNVNENVTTSDLPVARWAGGTDQFHSRLGTKAWNDIAEKMQRQGVISFMYAIGNTAWTTTTGLVETAVNFCVLDKAGGAVDQAAHKLGNAVMKSGILAAFVVLSLVVYIWRIGRAAGGGGNSSLIMQKALIVGLFGLMLFGAAASTGGGKNGNEGPYRPGFGSPGWFITTIDNVVSASANSLTSNLANDAGMIQGAEEGWNVSGPRGGKGNSNLGCAPYVKAMKEIYKEKYSTYVGGKKYYEASASVPLMLSAMWEQSGLKMWQKAQFGDRNDYGKFSYCRLLEYNADAPRQYTEAGGGEDAVSIEHIMRRANAINISMGGEKFKVEVDKKNLAFRYSGSNKWRDRAWVGWAACSYPISPGGGNDKGRWLIHKDDGVPDSVLAKVCEGFFTERDWDGTANNGADGGVSTQNGSDGDGLDWDDSNNDITETDTTAEAEDFLLSLHGNKNRAGIVSGFTYMISSVLVGAVFALFAIAILVAKVAALMMMLMIFFMLLVALLPNMSAAKVGDYAKQYFGLSLFAWGAQLLLGVMALITGILIAVGGSVVPEGPGGVMGLMWTGFAPVIAAMCLHLMFKKMRVPSPLKPSSGMAWGQMAASGAVAGGAAAGGAMLGSRLANRAKGMAVRKGQERAGALVGKDRRSRMTPGGPGEKKAATDPKAETKTGKGKTDAAVAAAGGNGAHTKAEQARAERAEKKEAKQFARTAEGKEALAAQRQAAGRGAKAHVKDRLANARAEFAAKPLRTTAKAAAIGAGAVTATAFAPAALVGAGLAAGAIGTSGVAKTLRTANPLDRARSQQDKIEAFRRHAASAERSQDQASAMRSKGNPEAAGGATGGATGGAAGSGAATSGNGSTPAGANGTRPGSQQPQRNPSQDESRSTNPSAKPNGRKAGEYEGGPEPTSSPVKTGSGR